MATVDFHLPPMAMGSFTHFFLILKYESAFKIREPVIYQEEVWWLHQSKQLC